MKKLVVDFNNFATLDDFHNFIADELGLSSEYGRNLDALHHIAAKEDCEFEVKKGGPVLIEMQELIETVLCHDVNN